MMRSILLAFLIICVKLSFAQVTEVNPNIKWKFVRSQTIEFSEGKLYQFEFPAEAGYDYIFNLTHNLEGVNTQISVFDIQYQPVATLNDSSSVKSCDLHFRVNSNGTFIVVLRISGSDSSLATLPTTLSLVRRVRID
jgi:hypothetical protein